MRVIGYGRVSTDQQGASGLGMDAQAAKIREECARRSWELVDIEQDIASGKSTNGRHGLKRAMSRIEAGEAGALVVTKMDRLARSVIDGATIMERANRRGWALVVLELGLDTTTPMGKFGGHIWLAAAEMERALIGQRTREALAEAKKRGVTLGRRAGTYEISPDVRAEIVRLRGAGLSLRAVAARLDEAGHTPPRSARWTPETVRQVVLAEASAEAH